MILIRHDLIIIKICMWIKVLTWNRFNQCIYVIWLLLWFHFNPYVFSPVLCYCYILIQWSMHVQAYHVPYDLYTCVSFLFAMFWSMCVWASLVHYICPLPIHIRLYAIMPAPIAHIYLFMLHIWPVLLLMTHLWSVLLLNAPCVTCVVPYYPSMICSAPQCSIYDLFCLLVLHVWHVLLLNAPYMTCFSPTIHVYFL